MPLQSWLTQFGVAKETTWGTAVAPSTADQFMMVMNPRPSDEIDEIRDNGFRSLAGLDQGVYQGFRIGKYIWEMHAYPQPIGHAIMGLLGTDVISGVGPYTHTINLLNTGLPPSYTLNDFYGVTGTNTRQYAGHYIESLAISGATTGPLKCTITTLGKASPGTALTTKPTGVYDTATPIVPWNGAVTLNSVSNLKVLQVDLLLKRQIDPILAPGSQDPSAGNVAGLEVTGKLIFAPNDDTEQLLYTTAQQAAFPLSIVYTSGTNTLTLQMTKVNFIKPSVQDRSHMGLYKFVPSFRATHNSTDGGPIKITLVNQKSAAY